MNAPPHRTVRWRPVGQGDAARIVSVVRDETRPEAPWGLHGVEHDGPSTFVWRIFVRPDGTARRLTARRGDGASLAAERTEAGWTVDGAARPDLARATDVDISSTPATNAFPIRRLALAIGDAAEIDALFLDAGAMTLRPARQRYTRLADRLWRYEGLDTGFSADLPVDADGFVTDYPGLYEREGTWPEPSPG